MIAINSKAYLILIICLCGLSCSSKENEIELTENEVFNSLLQEKPITIIDLDGVSIDTLLVKEEHLLGTKQTDFFTEPVYLGFPTTSLVTVDNSVYVASGAYRKVFAMSESGVWLRSIGGKGRGPGEFAGLLDIDRNDQSIFVFDYDNERIQLYDHQLEPTQTIRIPLNYTPLFKDYAVSNDHIYLRSDFVNGDFSIDVYDINNFEERVESFWPRIIPYGFQPASYNSLIFDVNSKEEIAISQAGLPYLFLLDRERDRQSTIYFKSSYYSILDNPSAKPFKVEGNTGVKGGSSFIKEIILKDDATIFFTVGKNVYQMNKIDGEYRLTNAWSFILYDDSQHKMASKTIAFSSIFIEDGIIHFITFLEGSVYKIELEEMSEESR